MLFIVLKVEIFWKTLPYFFITKVPDISETTQIQNTVLPPTSPVIYSVPL